jgi:D-alanyl-D-alanine carboxypeptidase/D-alanyl-D-alanine-endopeptidase (penicillin-binding protein 4)
MAVSRMERGLMRRNRVFRGVGALAALAAAFCMSAWTPATRSADDDALALLTALRSDLNGILRAATSSWRSSRWSVLAISIDRGDTLFAVGAGEPLAPASNLKLMTTATAVDRLGPGFRYQTFLLASGPVVGGRLQGDLILYGTGDPGLSDRFRPSGRNVLEAFADSLVALGVVTIEGDLVGDGSYFSGPLLGDGWNPDDLNDAFAAASGALSFDENVFTLRVRSLGSGVTDITTLPEGAGVPVLNQAVVGDGGGLSIRREHPTQPIQVQGSVSSAGREVWRQMTVPDPAHFAASVFRGVLEQKGIRVMGSTRTASGTAESGVTGRTIWAPGVTAQPAPRLLARHVSPPIIEYLTVVNKRSHNLLADQVFKTLGRVVEGEGSFAGGSRAVSSFLGSIGVDTSRVEIHDGSGLSTFNRVSAGDFVTLLAHMADHRDWEAFWGTLPEAGNPRELRRMGATAAAGNLRAKTGTIRNVSALSGVVRSTKGERIAFSIIANHVPSTGSVKRVEDRIGSRLASFGRPLTAAPVPTMMAAAPDTVESAPTVTAQAPTVPTAPDGGAAAEPAAEPAGSEGPTQQNKQTHRVQSGENLTVIARRYGISVNTLMEANSQLSPRRLQVGTMISIPSTSPRP